MRKSVKSAFEMLKGVNLYILFGIIYCLIDKMFYNDIYVLYVKILFHRSFLFPKN